MSRDVHHRGIAVLLRICTLSLGLTAGAVGRASAFSVTATDPPRHSMAPPTTAITVHFDQPVAASSIDAASVRVFGKWSGVAAGSFTFQDGGQSLVFTPTQAFAAGEVVSVHLSNGIRATDDTPFRPQGYAFQFMTSTVPTALGLWEISRVSNRTDSLQTRIYGACAADLNADGYPDLTTVNEVSGDVRVALNRGDGTGAYHDFLPPQAIGQYASPNEPADFDHDGKTDLCIAATGNDSVWVLLGNGDGTFGSISPYPSGVRLHCVAVLDVDGDADPDIVTTNMLGNDCALLVNDGTGHFTHAGNFEGGVDGEDGLAAADMDNDGITDILVAGRWSETIVVHRGNGDGTFAPPGPPQDSGGETWVIAVGDLNGDGNLDATTANNFTGTGAVLLGNGDGTFQAPLITQTASRITSTDLGDLDGDGDLDWVLSSFGGKWWRIFKNDGSGGFTLFRQIDAPSNPSCAVLVDVDRDGDLDVCLTDEIADLVLLMENTNSPTGTDGVPSISGSPLLPNVPNPFAERTTIRFYLAAPGDVSLSVFDAAGRKVLARSLPGLPSGFHELPIPGRSDGGELLPSGAYFCQVRTPAWTETQRITLVR